MWEEINNKLYKKFEFKNFSEAFAFMTRVAMIAEKMDHHPEWKNVWNTVEFWLSTHDAGDIVTEKDKKLAAKIDALLLNNIFFFYLPTFTIHCQFLLILATRIFP